MALCAAFPMSVLGVMLGFSGMELAMVTRDQTDRTDAFTMFLTAAACLAVNTGVGFAIGFLLALALRIRPLSVDPEADKK